MRNRRSTFALLGALLGGAVAVPAQAADQTATWVRPSSGGLWSDAANWDTNPLFPNEGNGGFTYDVVFNSPGTVRTPFLDVDISLEQLRLDTAVNLNFQGHSLTINDQLTVANGSIFGGFGQTFADGGVEIHNSLSILDTHQFLNGASATWTPVAGLGAAIPISGSLFHNTSSGQFTADLTSFPGEATMGGPFNGFIVNDGTFEVLVGAFAGHGLSVRALFVNNGNLEIQGQGGFVQLGNSYTQNAGLLSVTDALLRDSQLDIQGGRFEASATLRSVNVDINGVLAPGGDLPGGMDLDGNSFLILGDDAVLEVDIAGRTQGTEYDAVFDAQEITLNGLLSVSFLEGFEDDLFQNDFFTILDADTISGTFDNAAPGARIFDASGEISFGVFYGPGSRFGSGKVVLAEFDPSTVPEPGTALLLAGGLALLGTRRARPRHSAG